MFSGNLLSLPVPRSGTVSWPVKRRLFLTVKSPSPVGSPGFPSPRQVRVGMAQGGVGLLACV